MSERKPLIFIHPLSKTLVQLKEVIEENAESDSIEVFEVESLSEMQQLLPTIGPSLTIISNPRKCAMLLQNNHRVVTRMKSKVIMLSPKFIPRRTLEKFMKIALTDCIVEPVAPKTLLYKVKLMLRSLPTDSSDKQEDIIVTSEDDEKLGNSDAQHVEKGVKLDGHYKGNINKEKEVELQLEGEEEDGIHTRSEAERKNDGHLRGDISEKEDDKGGNQEAEGYKESPMGGHYKGSIEQGLDLEPDMEEDDEEDLTSDDALAQAREDLNLNLVDEEAPEDIYHDAKEKESGKNAPELDAGLSLDLEAEEDKEASMENDNRLAGHLKGKIDNNKLELEDDAITEEHSEDEEKGGKSPFGDLVPNLDLEDDDPEISLDKEEAPKGIMNDKIDPTLQLDDDDEGDETQVGTDNMGGDLSGEGDKADQLDKYYKSNLEKGLELKEDGEDSNFEMSDDGKGKLKQNKNDTTLELIDGEGGKGLKSGDNGPELQLQDDLELADEEKELSIKGQLKKKGVDGDPNLDLELEEFKERKKREAEQAERDARGLLTKKKLDLEGEDGETYWEKDDKKGQLKKRNGNANLELEEEEKENKIQNHGVQHIQKYYGMKGGDTVEKGADWNGLKKKDEVWQSPEKIKNTEAKELIIPTVDRGEQTIDYSKLKAEFDISISTDRKKSVSEGHMDWGDKKKEEEKKPGLQLDNPEQDLFDTPLTEEEEEIIASKEPVFEPDSKGLENVIEILALYHDNKKDLYTILYNISQRIYDQTKGLTTFFLYNPQTQSYKEEFTGHLFIDTDIDKDLRESKWSTLKKNCLEAWKEEKLPNWEDSTFQEEHNQFIYPFYLGINNMGFAVTSFSNKVSEKDSFKVEIMLESARGGYLDSFAVIERAMKKAEEEKAGKKNKKKEKKGLLGGLFGKKKAS